MRQFFSACIFTASCLAATAQGEVEIFTEMGEKFTVYLNSAQQNASPAARVEIPSLDEGFYHVRIDFEDASLADFAKNNLGVENGTRGVYMIKLDRKGNYTLRLNSFTEMSGSATASAPSAAPPASSSPDIEITTGTGETMNARITMDGGTTTTTESVNMSINMGDAMKSMGAAMGQAMGNMNVSMTVTETVTETGTGYTETGTGTGTGSWAAPADHGPEAMSSFDFQDYLKAIQAKTFEDSKLSTAQAPLRSQYLTAEQIAAVMRAFTFEDTRLEFAKFAYNRCVDPGNYYKTHGAFEYELSIDELEEAIGQ